MTYADIKDKLRKPTQFICAEVSIQRRYYRTGNEVLLNDVKWWLKGIQNNGGEEDREGYLRTPSTIKRCTGSKDECQRVAREERFHLHCWGSTSRVEQLGMCRTTWMVLPADENGNWVPTPSMIKKVLETL